MLLLRDNQKIRGVLIVHYIGVDLGGTNIGVGVVSESGEIILQKSAPTLAERTSGEIIKDITRLCLEIASEAGIGFGDIASVGIGSPGVINPEEGTVVYSNNLNFRNVKICEDIEKELHVPVFVDNDANCAALGESVAGAAKGSKVSITITLGTGIGSGIIIDGKIYSGPFFGAGEFGHHAIIMDGELCTCGRKGCWESYASATGLIRDGKAAAHKNPDSKIMALVNGDISKVTGKVIFDAKDAGDETATAVVAQYIKYLAAGIGNVVNIFQPEIIAITGGISAQGDKLLIPLTELVKKLVFGGELKTKIVISTLGNNAGIIGAAMLNRQV